MDSLGGNYALLECTRRVVDEASVKWTGGNRGSQEQVGCLWEVSKLRLSANTQLCKQYSDVAGGWLTSGAGRGTFGRRPDAETPCIINVSTSTDAHRPLLPTHGGHWKERKW